jgi:hypothetical protein
VQEEIESPQEWLEFAMECKEGDSLIRSPTAADYNELFEISQLRV